MYACETPVLDARLHTTWPHTVRQIQDKEPQSLGKPAAYTHCPCKRQTKEAHYPKAAKQRPVMRGLRRERKHLWHARRKQKHPVKTKATAAMLTKF